MSLLLLSPLLPLKSRSRPPSHHLAKLPYPVRATLLCTRGEPTASCCSSWRMASQPRHFDAGDRLPACVLAAALPTRTAMRRPRTYQSLWSRRRRKNPSSLTRLQLACPKPRWRAALARSCADTAAFMTTPCGSVNLVFLLSQPHFSTKHHCTFTTRFTKSKSKNSAVWRVCVFFPSEMEWADR